MKTITFFVLMLLSANCLAMSGNDVLNNCGALFQENKTIEQTMDGLNCVGYVGGLNDMAVLYAGITKVPFYCPPRKEGLETGQVVRVFLMWLESHPAELHESARSLFISAMGDSFPCEP